MLPLAHMLPQNKVWGISRLEIPLCQCFVPGWELLDSNKKPMLLGFYLIIIFLLFLFLINFLFLFSWESGSGGQLHNSNTKYCNTQQLFYACICAYLLFTFHHLIIMIFFFFWVEKVIIMNLIHQIWNCKYRSY